MVTKKLKIVARFGGFHSLMSSINAVGCSIGRFGLERIIEKKGERNTFMHISSGKAITRTLYFHFLVHLVLPVKLHRHFMTNYSGDTDVIEEERSPVTEPMPCGVILLPQILKHYVTIQTI